jgi:imidazolonepropionase-like amidohydrolase
MRRPLFLPVVLLAPLAVLVATRTTVIGQFPGSSNGYLALVGGTIYVNPTDEPIRNGVVLIQAGHISVVGHKQTVKIPQNTQLLDCSGLTITAGFWNSHVHFFERKWANAAEIPKMDLGRQLQDMITRYGFTSVFDLGSIWQNTRIIRQRIESGEVPGPRIRSTGEALVAPGAIPSAQILGVLGEIPFHGPEITDATQAVVESRKLLDEGVNAIKIHLQPPPPPNRPIPESAIQAAVGEAHRSGKPVFLHPNSGTDVLAAINDGVDVVAHTTPQSGPWEDAIPTAVKQRHVALTPTLAMWEASMRHDRISVQEQLAITGVGQLRAWVAAGGTVLFGTDLGTGDYDPSEEYALMARAGMSLRQILTSLTTAPAQQFGASQRLGRIAPGLLADLTILKGDPSKNIRTLAAVKYTLRDGRIIYRSAE